VQEEPTRPLALARGTEMDRISTERERERERERGRERESIKEIYI